VKRDIDEPVEAKKSQKYRYIHIVNSRNSFLLQQNDYKHESGSTSHASNGLNLLSMSATDPIALNALSFNGPFSYESLKTVTTKLTSLLPSGMGPSIELNTVRLFPSAFTVAAEFPSTSSTNPNTFAASIDRPFTRLSAVASNLRQSVLSLLGTYWFAGHSTFVYRTFVSSISPENARATSMGANIVVAHARTHAAAAFGTLTLTSTSTRGVPTRDTARTRVTRRERARDVAFDARRTLRNNSCVSIPARDISQCRRAFVVVGRTAV